MSVLDTHALQLPGLPFHYSEQSAGRLGPLHVSTHQQGQPGIQIKELPSFYALYTAIRKASQNCSRVSKHTHSENGLTFTDTIYHVNTNTLYKHCHTTIPKPLFDLAVCILASRECLGGQAPTNHVNIQLGSDGFTIDCAPSLLSSALHHTLFRRFSTDLDERIPQVTPADAIVPASHRRSPGETTDRIIGLAAALQDRFGLNSHLFLYKGYPPHEGSPIFLKTFSQQARDSRFPLTHAPFSHGFLNRGTTIRRELGSVSPARSAHPHGRRGSEIRDHYLNIIRCISFKLDITNKSRCSA